MSEIWGDVEISRVVFMPNIPLQFILLIVYTTTWEIQSSNAVFIFVELFRFVGEQNRFEVLVLGPAGPDIEPCTFLSILVSRIFF